MEASVASQDNLPDSTKRSIETNDTGNGKLLVREFGNDIRFVWSWDQWLVWDGARWKVDDSGEVERLAKKAASSIYGHVAAAIDSLRRQELAKWANYSLSRKGVEAMLRMAKSEAGIVVRPNELDTDPWQLNLPNGTLDLRTGVLFSNSRKDLEAVSKPSHDDDEAGELNKAVK